MPLVLGLDASFRPRTSGNYIKDAIVRPALYRHGAGGTREGRNRAGGRASSRIEFRRLSRKLVLPARARSSRIERVKVAPATAENWKLAAVRVGVASVRAFERSSPLKFPGIYSGVRTDNNVVPRDDARDALRIIVRGCRVNNVGIIPRRMARSAHYDFPRAEPRPCELSVA